jgi:hypothetical protein
MIGNFVKCSHWNKNQKTVDFYDFLKMKVSAKV